MRIVAMVILLLPMCVIGQVRSKAVESTTVLEEGMCPDERPWVGHYQNWSYGFSIDIPSGYLAHWNSPPCSHDEESCVCMSDHGRIIELSKESYIEAFAAYVGNTEANASAYAEESISAVIRYDKLSKVRVKERTQLIKCGAKALEVLYSYESKGVRYVRKSFFVVADGIGYQVCLAVPASQFTAFQCDYDDVVGSFVLTERQ